MKNNEVFDFSQSIYCYEGTKTLKNKKDITDNNKLREVENGITAYKLSKIYLEKADFKKTFDENHYLNIHKYLFEDLYDFAGNIRDENISKSRSPYDEGKTPFCQVCFIYRQLHETLRNMKNSVRSINSYEQLIEFISTYYLELNIIHPFREGNGRALREFIRCLGLFNNYIIDWSLVEDEEFLNASIDSVRNYRNFVECIRKTIM